MKKLINKEVYIVPLFNVINQLNLKVMENIVLAIIVIILLVIGNLVMISKYNTLANDITRTPLWIINNIEISNKIHPLVIEIYKEFIANPTAFTPGFYTCETPFGNIWTANKLHNRRFDTISLDVEQRFGNRDTINNALTLADMKILDAIANRVKNNSDAFIKEIFIHG